MKHLSQSRWLVGLAAFAMTAAVSAYGGPLIINGFYAPATAPATVSLASNLANQLNSGQLNLNQIDARSQRRSGAENPGSSHSSFCLPVS